MNKRASPKFGPSKPQNSENVSAASTRKFCTKWGPRKNHNTVFLSRQGLRKKHGQLKSKNLTSNEKFSENSRGEFTAPNFKEYGSEGVRIRFRVRFQAVKVSIFGGFPVENPTKIANGLKALLRATSLSEYGSEGFRVRLRRLSEYGSVAYLVERPTRETGRTVLGHRRVFGSPKILRSTPRLFWGYFKDIA